MGCIIILDFGRVEKQEELTKFQFQFQFQWQIQNSCSSSSLHYASYQPLFIPILISKASKPKTMKVNSKNLPSIQLLSDHLLLNFSPPIPIQTLILLLLLLHPPIFPNHPLLLQPPPSISRTTMNLKFFPLNHTLISNFQPPIPNQPITPTPPLLIIKTLSLNHVPLPLRSFAEVFSITSLVKRKTRT